MSPFSSQHQASVPLVNNGVDSIEKSGAQYDAVHSTVESKEFGKDTATVNTRALDDSELESNEIEQGRSWQVGIVARFPRLSLCCLGVIIACTAGLVIVLYLSDGKRVDTWDATTIAYKHHSVKAHIGVSTWIAIFNFITGKALGAMFAEAVAISWWVDAMSGQTLALLHYRWEVGQSVVKILTRQKIWGWICVASVAAVTFSALESLLQQASTTMTAPLTYTDVPLTALVASRLPAGFSGVQGSANTGRNASPIDQVADTAYFTPEFQAIVQGYTVQSPIAFKAAGCSSAHNGWCAATFPGVGFSWTCNSTRHALPPQNENGGFPVRPASAVFAVDFTGGGIFQMDTWDNVTVASTWHLTLNATWKDTAGVDGTVLPQVTCDLTPAVVNYNVNITQDVASLLPATSTVVWTDGSDDTVGTLTAVDQVVSVLPQPPYDAGFETFVYGETNGYHTTLGGISVALSKIFSASIVIDESNPDQGDPSLDIVGAFAMQYAQFTWDNVQHYTWLNNTFTSPMPALMANIRDIMFRSSVAIAQQNITDWAWTSDQTPDENTFSAEYRTSYVPAYEANTTGVVGLYATVYKTHFIFLSIAIALMGIAVLAILPLYRGFWRLGRKVSLSPFEISKALHNAHTASAEDGSVATHSALDARGGVPPQAGSNFSDDELMAMLGGTRVRYGEVAPNTLGMGLYQHTNVPRKFAKYH